MPKTSVSKKKAGNTARWSLRLLGGFELTELPGRRPVTLPGKRERVLLAYLALSPNCRQPRRKLAALLWGDAADETILDNLRTSLWGVRKALGDTKHRYIFSDAEHVVLDIAAFEVDVLLLRRLAAHAAPVKLRDVANLGTGEFLSGLSIKSDSFESWAGAETTRCRDQVGEVFTQLMKRLIERGETQRAIETGTQILTMEPLHEDAARHLMRLYTQCGRRVAAIQLYRTLAAAIRAELDTEPEAETRALFEAIVQGNAGIVRQDVARAVEVAPSVAQISVAVLPFVNLSRDVDQEFFSDGISEEITAALTQIKGLRVVGRASAFQIKGGHDDLRAVGRDLGASHLIEGSVRKAGNRVRITAQLIRVAEGAHLWAQSYDRELTDVFAIQENIAQAIAASLQVPQGLKEGQSLVPNRTSDTDSYQDYLRARALMRVRGSLEPGGPLTEAAKLLEQIVARDPNYAPALGLLGQVHALIPSFCAALVNGSTEELRSLAAESLRKSEIAAQNATRIDPNNIDGYTARAFARNYRGQFVQADDLFKHARLLDPGNPEALHQYGLMLAGVGLVKDSLQILLRLQTHEPLVPVFNRVTAEVLWLNGRIDEAIALLKALPPAFGPRLRLAEVYASVGCFSEAADALRDLPSGIFHPGTVEEATRILRIAPAKIRSSHALLRNTRLGFVYLYTGAPIRVLDFFEGLADAGCPALGNPISRLWAPSYAPVRRTERFKAYVSKTGIVDYWRARGWPDLCHPASGDDFACH